MAHAQAVTLLREGIAAAQTGDKSRTRALLRQVTELDPANEVAWLWRASSAESAEEALDCLRKTLGVNPHNEKAKAALPDALVRAAGERLTPILMTACAAGIGLVPLLFLGSRAGGELEQPMALVIVGGLLTSTWLNLFLVPVWYRRAAS